MSRMAAKTRPFTRRSMKYAEPDPLAVVGHRGDCPHVLTVWEEVPARRPQPPSYRGPRGPRHRWS